ncbi:MAG: triose-phosphate isomerase [Myxococcota bacterium]|nr:triose-phosphate isomerase [Myxococcota bacterium]
MRKSFVAGNWKMATTTAQAKALAGSLLDGITSVEGVDVAVIPPFLAIPAVVDLLRGSTIAVGAQDVYFEKSGAFTGEISCEMLIEAGCGFALVGHSERRHILGETDPLVRKKLDALLAAGMDAILCVGETIEEREAGSTEARLETQVRSGLEGVTLEQARRVTVAYEPVWAIGTGKTATASQAQEAHRFIRGLLAGLFDEETAGKMRIQYGGSVKPENAGELMTQPDIDGALVGGASLKPASFLGIVQAA